MNLEPWHKIVTPRPEVSAGRSFSPDEFAIHLDQVVSGSAPADYQDPEQFFARTCFTGALRDHLGMVLRRLSGETANTAPVLSLVTQFGGGKTHTLTALYHLVKNADRAAAFTGVAGVLREARLSAVPAARVAVFVGNAWDPGPGFENPWIDLARQLAGDAGVAALGPEALTTPPGTIALGRLFAAAGGSVLILCDEVLNFVNRYRRMADHFYAFIQNLTTAMTGTTHSAAMISLPRSQTEMTEWDASWQEKITKVVHRVSTDLLALDEAEIGEVVRRRLFKDLGDERVRRRVAEAFADWCFERRAQIPPEWTAVDTATTEAHSRDFLRSRFESCYPFHPATLSVFQRKWRTLAQYQQTRGTLAMLAQWVSLALRDAYTQGRQEPLITLGSAPLDVREFRSLVLGQIGEQRLDAAIETDIAGKLSHSHALDTDTKDALLGIHRRAGAAIFFECCGGQVDKVAQLTELRFALGDPEVDTTSVDNAAIALEGRAFYVRRVGADLFRINYRPTLKKVVSDRRASLDLHEEILPEMRKRVKAEFDKGRTLAWQPFPAGSSDVPDSPSLTLVLLDPEVEWGGSEPRQRLAEWTRQHGDSARLYPAALVWCVKKPGHDLRERVETQLAWQKVKADIDRGVLGEDLDPAEIQEVSANIEDAKTEARDEVWASYRFVVLADSQEPDGLKVIDLGAGHSGGVETLCGRVITALKSQALLNESVGAGYIERHWPAAFQGSGAWPITGLRQSFLNGALTRLLDPDTTLRAKIIEFVLAGDFGLGSGPKNGGYERVWFKENIAPDEVQFEPGLFLLWKSKAEALKQGTPVPPVQPETPPTPPPQKPTEIDFVPPPVGPSPTPPPQAQKTLRVVGTVPTEIWNRLGTKLIPKLRSSGELQVTVELSVTVNADLEPNLRKELQQLLIELGVGEQVKVETS